MASEPKVDPAVATRQIKRIKELSEQLASQAFGVKMMGQNAKTYKADCVSFANRIQLASERAANFAKTIEEDLPEVVAMKYDLEAATEELEKSNREFIITNCRESCQTYCWLLLVTITVLIP